jgi:hypothetical protein
VENAEDRSVGAVPDPLDVALEKARLAMIEASKRVDVEEEEEESLDVTNSDAPSKSQDEDSDDPAPVDQDDDEDEDEDKPEEGEIIGDSDDTDDDDSDIDEDDDLDSAPESTGVQSDKDTGKQKDGSRRQRALKRLKEDNEKLKADYEKIQSDMQGMRESLLADVRAEQQRVAQLQAAQIAAAEEERAHAAEVDEFLGSDEDHEADHEAALAGDFEAAERYKQREAMRKRFITLQSRAERVVQTKAGQVFAEATKGLPGLDANVLQNGNLYQVIRHIAIGSAAHERNDAEQEKAALVEKHGEVVEKLNNRIQKLEARISQLKLRKMNDEAPTPLAGGRPAAEPKPKSKLAGMLGPDGLPTLEALQAASSGRINWN